MGQERFVSYAQNLEDVMLWRALRDAVPGPGFYIDVGAADATALSVTRAFYDRGWRGIDVEPLPEEARALAAARPRDVVVQAALGDADGRATLRRVSWVGQTGLSTLDVAAAARHEAEGAEVRPVDVPMTTLAALCRAHVQGPVHFLKVDVEGSEAAVLAGADFAAVRPWIVVVEATEPALGTEAAGWEPALLAAGYRRVWFDGLNRFYLAEEQAALARHFTVQPNVFDAYEVYDPAARARIVAAEVLAVQRAEMVSRLRTEIVRLTEAAAPVTVASAEQAVQPEAVAPVQTGLAQTGPVHGWRRRLVLGCYRLVRPVLRPVAWRLRTFLVGDMRRELFELGARQDLLLARAAAPAAAVEDGMPAAMERLLLTLALQDGRDRAAGAACVFPKAGVDG